MSHLHRFHVSPEALRDDSVTLPEQEAHHALRVARVRVGDRIAVFDGQGQEGSGPLTDAAPDDVRVSIETRREVPFPARSVTLAQAWLNREKSIEPLIIRGAELGVSRFVFFRGDHSERAPRIQEKWNRLAIESCKQTGNLWLPTFETADNLDVTLGDFKGCRLVASVSGPHTALRDALMGEEDILLAIGPEGDFSEREIDATIDAKAALISLGEKTLRSEIAAATGLALIQYELGNLGPIP